MTDFAKLWADALPNDHREALYDCLCLLTDDFLNSENPEDSSLAWNLPRKYLPRYTEVFLRRFFISFLTVGYKLAYQEPTELLPSCVAEELGLHILIEGASAHLKDVKQVKADFSLFEDLAFQDGDFEYLYNPKYDGIEDSSIGAEHGIGLLHIDEWFIPFDNAITPVHPYSADE